MIDHGWKMRTFCTFIVMQSLGNFRVPTTFLICCTVELMLVRDRGWADAVRSEKHCVNY